MRPDPLEARWLLRTLTHASTPSWSDLWTYWLRLSRGERIQTSGTRAAGSQLPGVHHTGEGPMGGRPMNMRTEGAPKEHAQ